MNFIKISGKLYLIFYIIVIINIFYTEARSCIVKSNKNIISKNEIVNNKLENKNENENENENKNLKIMYSTSESESENESESESDNENKSNVVNKSKTTIIDYIKTKSIIEDHDISFTEIFTQYESSTM
ncbi:hypothetical protein LY90DRAFT_520177, partial [Neocallimastix californiae]